MMTMPPHGTAPRRDSIDREGAPNGEAAQATRQRARAVCLDDERQVIRLNGECSTRKALRLEAASAARTLENNRSPRKEGTDARARNVT
jgi:hypothetical protein